MQDILDAEKFYDHHRGLLISCAYLATLSEDNTLYDLYKDVVHRDHVRIFADFTQEHRDIYLRLKLRGLRPSNVPPNNIISTA